MVSRDDVYFQKEAYFKYYDICQCDDIPNFRHAFLKESIFRPSETCLS